MIILNKKISHMKHLKKKLHYYITNQYIYIYNYYLFYEVRL